MSVYPVSKDLQNAGVDLEKWITKVVNSVVVDLNNYGVCVLDGFLQKSPIPELAESLRAKVVSLHAEGRLAAGQVRDGNVKTVIRSDLIAWMSGAEPGAEAVKEFMNCLDVIVYRANRHANGGRFSKYNLRNRSRMMVACYPGQNTHYKMHIDNASGDGRALTAIYYLNKDWKNEDGGQLMIHSQMAKRAIGIVPSFDRLLFFWADSTNPHEVKPARAMRYAITCWYLDEVERRAYYAKHAAFLQACKAQAAKASSASTSSAASDTSSQGEASEAPAVPKEERVVVKDEAEKSSGVTERLSEGAKQSESGVEEEEAGVSQGEVEQEEGEGAVKRQAEGKIEEGVKSKSKRRNKRKSPRQGSAKK